MTAHGDYHPGAPLVFWGIKEVGANGEGRTPMPFQALEPKSRASANSATFARGQVDVGIIAIGCMVILRLRRCFPFPRSLSGVEKFTIASR